MKRPHCMAPFVQLTLRHDGFVTPCCYLYSHFLGKADSKYPIIPQIWNNEELQKFREEQFAGTPPACSAFSRALGCEQDFNKWRNEVDPKVVMPGPPLRLDIRLSGECNLHCLMCDVWKNKGTPYTEENFWSRASSEIFPFVKEIDLVGGEPFLQSYTFRLLEEAYAVNPKIRFGFITNGQWDWTQKIESLLEKIEISFIQMSLDSLEEKRYSQIRRGGSLAKCLQTLEALLVLRIKKEYPIAVSQLLSSLNWDELNAFAAFAQARNIAPRWQLLRAPDTLSLFHAPEKLRTAAREAWKMSANVHPFPQIAALVQELENS